jgi:hypothetical protein
MAKLIDTVINQNGDVIPYAIVNVYKQPENSLFISLTTDIYGMFYLEGPAGVYNLEILREGLEDRLIYAVELVDIFNAGDLGDSANLDVGTGPGTVAAGDHVHQFAEIQSKPTTLDGYGITDAVNIFTLGQPNGVATLDVSGKVPASQLPSYVDDVLEFANLASFPNPGESGKIYVALDTNKTFRWGGSSYIYINAGEPLINGTATQSTDKNTGVLLNTDSGTITTAGSTLLTSTIDNVRPARFLLSNSRIGANDCVILNQVNGSPSAYNLWVDEIQPGACYINIVNVTGNPLSEAFAIKFCIVRG